MKDEFPESKIYFYYSKIISEKFHDDAKKIFFPPVENNSVLKGLTYSLVFEKNTHDF